MTGADVGASLGRPEYVIPALDLEGYFQRFFADRQALRRSLPPPSTETPVERSQPSDPSLGIADVESWVESLAQQRPKIHASPWREGLDVLQKKFAVFGRIQKSYDASMRKTTEEEVSASTLCRLASILLARYRSRNDLNSLNSAIKLLDKAALAFRSGAPDSALAAELSKALALEESILRELHHD
ncbi:MAG: hypothetical protein IPK50_09265 [Fibrobacterota bacterium]|nr:hypothetical protein [Fibrobacterota bacterium]QQS07066.1 MAG: hypothetical protein IPK50_09265 [Fibrobacterota bacterium]